MLAWTALDRYEGRGDVVFADSEAEAHRLAEDRDLGDEVTRAPELDRWAPGPVPRQALLDAGWWFECRSCGHHVMGDGCSDCAEEAEEGAAAPEPYVRGETVYCSRACYADDVQERWERRRRARETEAAGREMVGRRWPGATYLRSFRTSGERVVHEFTFPGSKHGAAHLIQPALQEFGAWGPPERETLLVPQGDVEAYRAFEDTILAARASAAEARP